MRKVFLIASLALACTGVGAQNLLDYGIVKPLEHELHENQILVKSWVKTDGQFSSKTQLYLDDCRLSFTQTAKSDSINVWLPLVGKENILSLKNGRKTVSTLLVQAPVSSDWGYFANGTIHIIQSSHQDIAWMDTPDYCRNERINDIIIPALDMMKENPDFKFEMEQVLNLMEFLEAHPERKDEVIQRYKEGRFLWGATFNQPYEGLSSGEQLVRQIYFGRKWVKENLPGCDDKTANNIDVPGRSLQMPQILAKSGVDKLLISRFGEGLYNWFSPDGSSVCTYTPGNYGWATLFWKYFDTDAVFALQGLHDRLSLWQDYYRERNIPPHYAILMSCDATKPRDFDAVIADWNHIADTYKGQLPHLQYSTAHEFMSSVNKEGAQLEKISGERPNLWLYIHGPAHYQQTLAKREAAILLPDAEMFSVLAGLDKEFSYPRAELDRGWVASIYPDHGLGGKNGHITDSIYTDSLVTAKKIGEAKLADALHALNDEVSTTSDSYVIYNDLTWNRSGYVSVPVESGAVVIYDNGKSLPVQYMVRDGKKYAVFYAGNIPSVGYKSFKCVKTKRATKTVLPEEVSFGKNYYDNAFYHVVLGNGGIVSLVDKSTGRDIVQNEKFSFGDVIELGYTGNGAGEFTEVKNVVPGDIHPLSALTADWKVKENGPLFTVFENVQKTTHATIAQKITFYHSTKKIDFDVDLIDFTGEHNRQYRIAFPLDMKQETSAIDYEVPMGMLRVGRDELKTVPGGWAWDGTYNRHPAETHPREIQNFITASGNGIGFTMSSCVAVADWIDPSREIADYTMLQGILLSSHKSCHGLGNWYHQTGSHSFHFSIKAHEEGWENGYSYGIEANRPLRAEFKKKSQGSLPAEQSFIQVSDPFTSINAFKKADNDDAVIIRLTEMEGKDKTVTVTLPFQVTKVVSCNMIEDELGEADVKVDGNRLVFKLGHHAIETYKLVR